MPHDANGNVLAVGDIVNIPCVVKEVYSVDDYCNVELESVHDFYPDKDRKEHFTINAKMVVKEMPPNYTKVDEVSDTVST